MSWNLRAKPPHPAAFGVRPLPRGERAMPSEMLRTDSPLAQRALSPLVSLYGEQQAFAFGRGRNAQHSG
jgi:hypothetical protein